MTTTEPKLEQRSEQPYVAIRTHIPMGKIGELAPPLLDEVMEFLQAQGVSPSGPPFFRYMVVDMERELEMEVGWSIADPLTGNGRVVGDALPAGRYATMRHTGHPNELVAVNGKLLAWGEANGIRWEASEDQKTWAARIEFYFSDPDSEPDTTKWETELAFLTAAD